MSSEVKLALKEARRSYKDNRYEETIKRCQKILKKDKDNYAALLLLAAAMREVEEFKSQAPLILERAVEIQSDNPLAWQGLMTCYENDPGNEETQSKLALVYCKLMQLNSDSPKFPQFFDKVSDLISKIRNVAVLTEIVQTLDWLRHIHKDKSNVIDKSLAWILTEYFNNNSEYNDLLASVLASVTKDVNVMNRQDYYRKYLKVLYDLQRFTVLVEEAMLMHKHFLQDVYPLELICKVYCEQYIFNGNSMNIEILEFSETLLKLDSESESGLVANAIYLQATRSLIKSKECLNRLLLMKPYSLNALILLSEINKRLYCWEDTENTSREALKYLKYDTRNHMRKRMELLLMESMIKGTNKQKWQRVAEMCQTFSGEEPSVDLQLIHARTSVLLNDPQVSSVLDKLESIEETKVQAIILRALNFKNHRKYEEAVNILDSALENSEAWLLLGKIYWDMADYNHSLMAFLKSIQIDRHNWECLVYIGHYYYEYGSDIERSRRCYQTALQINPNSEEAGIGLSTTYRLLKNKEANMQLLQRLTRQGSGPKWAWLQLGLQYLDQEDAGQAIKALQHVIRVDPNDNHIWESLADAYLVRGAHMSALRSYQRALELCPGSLYPMIQYANIKLVIGELKEAEVNFKQILEYEPCDIYALKGLAETYLGLAKENIAKQLLGCARDNLQQGLNCLTNAMLKRTDLSCIWKLLGDVCYRVAIMPEKYCYLNVIPRLMNSNVERQMTVTKANIILLCTRCYCRALRLSQNSALLWHDLSCCYLMQLNGLPPPITSDRKDIARKCLAAAKHAVKLCSTSWLHWNVLGVICMTSEIKNYALAQHCFVMAIDRESNNAVAWCNLGTLYLHLGDPYRANHAFSRAQRAEPSYVNSWIGQGLIAEYMFRKEAFDLFRHSTQLGYHSQAALGYAHWVLTTLLNPEIKENALYVYIIKNMHAVSVATDVLNWYIEYHPDNAYARNAYGLLLERQRFYRSAAEEFDAAFNVNTDDEHKDFVRANLARVLTKLGKYDEAIRLCQTVEKINFNTQCHLALSLFKAERYEESYAAYEAALQWLAKTESDKANTLCAMAAMAYIFQGVDDVKTLLFQCIQMQPPTIPGFLAAASLGILHGDLNLTTLVLKELQPFQDHSEYGHHVANLSSYSYLIQGDVNQAIRLLSKTVHRHPSNVNCWVYLVRILLETDLNAFSKCAQKVLFLGRNISDVNIVQILSASSLSLMTQGYLKSAIRSAQKAVFMFPAKIESWATFIAALILRQKIERKCQTSIKQIFALMCTVQEFSSHSSNQRMAGWLSDNKRELLSEGMI